MRPMWALMAAVACAAGDGPVAPSSVTALGVRGRIAFVGANVLPMTTDVLLEDHTVVVDDGVITAVGPRGSTVVSTDARVIDARQLFVIPGLTDAHTHPEDESELWPYVVNGVTTMIALGHTPSTPMTRWRSESREGSLLAPTILTSGQIVDGAFPRSRAVIVSTPDDARAVVAAQVAEGVDYIKVYNSLEAPVYKAVVAEAARQGRSVLGHGVRAVGLEGMLEEGQVAIAHGEELLYTYFASRPDESRIPSAVEVLAGTGVWVMPNLSTFAAVSEQWGNTAALDRWLASDRSRYLLPERRAAWRRFHASNYATRSGSVSGILQFLQALTTALHDGEVPLLLSTDSPIIPGLFPGWSIHAELQWLVKAGLTPYEALRVGTVNGGRFVRETTGRDGRFGEIRTGWRGDLVVLSKDPRVDLTALMTPIGVMVRGRYLDAEDLRSVLDRLEVVGQS